MPGTTTRTIPTAQVAESAAEALVVRAAVPNRRRLLLSMLPSGLFLAANAIAGVGAAIMAASVVSAGLIVVRWRRRDRIGVLLPLTLGYVVVRGVVGVITQSEDVFFAFGLATSGLVAIAVLASAFTSKPVGLHVVPLFVNYSSSTTGHPRYRRVAAQVTGAWAVGELALTAWEAAHLTSLSAAEFIGVKALVAWPIMGVLIAALIFYVRLRLDPLEWQQSHQQQQQQPNGGSTSTRRPEA